jgi:hypothetical protein
MRRAPRWSDGKPHNTSDASRKGRHRQGLRRRRRRRHITVVVTAVVVAVTVGAFGSLHLGHLFPNVQIIIISSARPPTSSGYDRRSSRYPHSP